MSAPFNDGTKIFTTLTEINDRTGLPTGVVKPNIPTDPNYIAPITDLIACPLPGSPDPVTYDVAVTILPGFTTIIALTFGASDVDTATGPWTIIDRVYDGVIFATTVAAISSYIVKITYGGGLFRQTAVTTGATNVFIPGPFTAITAIEMLNNAGDFNIDYNADFY